jgi:hypothetical protein
MRVTAFGPQPGSSPAAPGTWLLPAPAAQASAYQSWGTLTGQPGTMPIPAPDPAAIPPGNLPTLGRGNIAGWPRRRSSSADSPNVILPALYYQRPASNPALGPDVSVISDNQLPVPAIDPRGRPAVMAQRPPRIGGRGQVVQPYQLMAWPKFTQGNPLAPS